MPRKNNGRRGRKSGGGDHIRLPLNYCFVSVTGTAQTTIETLAKTFDRKRAFRVAHVSGEFTAAKFPATIQFELFGPSSTADNIWSSPQMVVPLGVLRRFSFRIPASATGWFPSEAATSTPICQLANICLNSAAKSVLIGLITLKIALRPYEASDVCPSLQTVVPYPESSDDDEDDSVVLVPPDTV